MGVSKSECVISIYEEVMFSLLPYELTKHEYSLTRYAVTVEVWWPFKVKFSEWFLHSIPFLCGIYSVSALFCLLFSCNFVLFTFLSRSLFFLPSFHCLCFVIYSDLAIIINGGSWWVGGRDLVYGLEFRILIFQARHRDWHSFS